MSAKYIQERLFKLRKLLRAKNIDAILLFGRVNTQYYTGFTGTDSYAIVEANNDKQYIFLDSRYIEQGKVQCTEYEVVNANNGLLKNALDKIENQGYKTVALEAEYMPWHLVLSCQKMLKEVEFVPLNEELAEIRVIKDELELELLRKAIWISDEAFKLLIPEIRRGMTENQIAARLEYHMRCLGATSPSFTTICASGVRGALPHGVASDKIVEDGEAITIDFGALYKGYCSDITRTIFLGEPNPEILKIYNVVLEAQLAAEKFIKAGVAGKDAHEVAAKIIRDAGYGQYFGHGLGHSLGLEIHESPSASPRSSAALPAGSFITVEPGIYVPGLGGVRIEDTCLVLEDGLEVITSADKSIIIL